jgi:ABC-type lipoprotein release transport system permease subunit
MPDSIELRQRIAKLDGVVDVLPRLESFALISSGNKTKGAFFQGIDPLLDDRMTQISHKVVQGNFLTKNDDGVLLSQRLAGYMGVNVGDTIVLLSQGYHGVTAADLFPVRGIVKMPNPKLDKSLIIGSLKKVQEFYGAEGMLTSMVVNIKSKNDIDKVLPEVKKIIDSGSLVALSWTDMNKELKQQIESDNVSGQIMLAILYVVIFFGILGTIIMMTAERRKEFGVMVALGMHRYYLALIVFVETVLLGLVGALTGEIISMGIVAYYYTSPIRIGGEMKDIYEQFGIEPVLAFSGDMGIFLNQFYVVLALLFIAVLYSIVKISGFKIIDALHS